MFPVFYYTPKKEICKDNIEERNETFRNENKINSGQNEQAKPNKIRKKYQNNQFNYRKSIDFGKERCYNLKYKNNVSPKTGIAN